MRVFRAGAAVAVLTAEGLDRLLDYRAPTAGAREGELVEVPLGPRRVLGLVWGDAQGDVDEAKLRDIVRVLDAPPLAAAMRAFLARAADYTLTPLSVMLRLATRARGRAPASSARARRQSGAAAAGRPAARRAPVLASRAAA